MKESLTPFLNVWVIPKEICPEIVYDLPNSTEYSVFLQSNIQVNSMCVFNPEYARNFNQTILYGLKSNALDQLILYSNQKNSFLNPLRICRNLFCNAEITYPSFFQLKHHISNTTSNSTSMYFTLSGAQKGKLPLILNPLPLYNYTGQYTFSNEFFTADFHEIKHPSKKKKFYLEIILIFESVFMFFVVLLKIFISLMIYKSNRESNKKQEQRDKRPLTVVLNQYCPNTSAMLISV